MIKMSRIGAGIRERKMKMKKTKERSKAQLTPLGRLARNLKRDWQLLVLIAFPVAYFIIFKYVPMAGLNIAFRNYKVGGQLFPVRGLNDWQGFRWFKEFFESPFSWRVIRNTLILSAEQLLVTFPAPIILALLFNEIRHVRVKGFVQTVSYLPHFISVAVVVGIIYNIFSVNAGLVNEIRARMGYEAIDFLQKAQYFRPLYVGSSLWQTAGFSSIIYAAAIAGVDQSLYEAAYIDGSTRFKNVFYITLPSIAPTIITMLILAIGRLMAVGYEKVLLMYTPATYEVADIISTWVYRTGITNGKFSLAAAVDLFNSMINITLLVMANQLSKKLTDTSIF